MKKLEYPLIAVTLTEKDCIKIIVPALEMGLSRAGICQKISRNVLYGTRKSQGMGLHNSYTTMGLCHSTGIFGPHMEKYINGKITADIFIINKSRDRNSRLYIYRGL